MKSRSHAASAGRLFRILDVDESGTVTFVEFVHGLFSLRGGATAADIAQLAGHPPHVDIWTSCVAIGRVPLELLKPVPSEYGDPLGSVH